MANFGALQPQILPRFGSLVAWDDPTTLPLGVASAARNVRYLSDSVASRYGLSLKLNFGGPIGGGGVLRYLSPDTSGDSNISLLACTQQDGNIWAAQPFSQSSVTQLSTDAVMAALSLPRQTGLYAQCAQAYNRMTIAQSDLMMGVAPVLVVDGATLNLDPASDPPFGGTWQPSAYYRAGHVVSATDQTGLLRGVLFYAVSGGVSGAAEPAWPPFEGNTAPDNEITWQRIQIVASTGLTPPPAPALVSTTASGGSFTSGMTMYLVCTWTNQYGESVAQVESPSGTLGNVLAYTNTSAGPTAVTVSLPAAPADIAALPPEYQPTGCNLYAYLVAGTPDPTKIIDPSYYALVGSFSIGASTVVSGYPAGTMLPTVNTAYVSPSGNVSSGTRYMIVLYVNRNGYISGVSDAVPLPVNATVDGRKLLVQNLPLGPYNCVARILAFTVAGQSSAGPYFYIPADDYEDPGDGGVRIRQTATKIIDNLTTEVYLDFTDEYLEGSVDVTNYFDRIQIPPASDAYFSKTLNRVVYAGCAGYDLLISDLEDPEAVRVPGSNVAVSPADGDRTVCLRELREIQIAFKENSAHAVTPNDLDPSEWDVQELWRGMGPAGPRAIDISTSDEPGYNGEPFVVFAHQTGPYLYVSGAPKMFGRELMGTSQAPGPWKQINWAYGYTIRVAIDPIQHEAHFYVPMGTATSPNKRLTCNYFYGWAEPIIFVPRRGILVPNPNGRKWSIDDIAANDAWYVPQRYSYTAPYPVVQKIPPIVPLLSNPSGPVNGLTSAGGTLPNGTVGVAYYAAIAVSGGIAPYTVALSQGSLPSGVTLGDTGGLEGLPTEVGSYAFQVSVTDSSPVPNVVTANYTVAVANPANQVSAVNACILIAGADGGLYSPVEGQYHDQNVAGQNVGYFSQWQCVPGPNPKLGLQKIRGAQISGKGAGMLNVTAVDDQENIIPVTTPTRSMRFNVNAAGVPVETIRDILVGHGEPVPRAGIEFDNGGVADAWFEVHTANLYLQPWMSGRRA